MSGRDVLAALLALLACSRDASATVQLDPSSVSVAQPGDRGRTCVSLVTGGQEVAGTQNDLVWDGRCATLPYESACEVAGTHGKSLYARAGAGDDCRLRALVLSLSDVDPIADGVLYCCDFVVQAAPGTCCAVRVTDAGASDSRGNAVAGVVGGSASLCVAFAGAASPTPTATPAPSAGDGCQVAPVHGATAAPLLAALALGLVRRRR
jgi:MYXO-CTERM domain-containing protein